eukprot:Rmarinus@m.10293
MSDAESDQPLTSIQAAKKASDVEVKIENDTKMDESDDDQPLSALKSTERKPEIKEEAMESDDDEIPLSKLSKKPAPAQQMKSDEKLAAELSGRRSHARKSYKEDSSSEGDDVDSESSDEPKAKRKAKTVSKPTPKKRAVAASDSDSDVPLSKIRVKKEAPDAMSSDDDVPIAALSKTAQKAVKEESSDDDLPLSALKKEGGSRKRPAPKTALSDSDDDLPLSAMKKKSGKKQPATKRRKEDPVQMSQGSQGEKRRVKVKEEDLTEDLVEELAIQKARAAEANFYDIAELDISHERGGVKWKTLEHRGVIFPPPYEPHGVKIKYNGEPVTLSPAAEEAATFFAVMLETDYAKKEKFINNFFGDFKKILRADASKFPDHAKITSFKRIDFTPIHQWHLRRKEAKANMSKEEKKKIKEENEKRVEEYRYALVDGRKEKVGNFNVEPPGLFRGRGDHPLMGKIKKRTCPSDITINIGKGAKVPPVPEPFKSQGKKWKQVIHNQEVTWLAMWRDSITDGFKYVWLGSNSAFKTISDYHKFEKARELKNPSKKHPSYDTLIDYIRADYRKLFKSKDQTLKQCAVAIYFIDKLALRVGNEKDSDKEADTVGCCSLRKEHISLNEEKNEITFDFLGKDSMRYFNTVEVDPKVFELVKEFMHRKQPEEDLFDKLTVGFLNSHIKSYLDGLSAKVFRTFNASFTLQQELDKLEETPNYEKMSVADKVAFYNRANREVAILCNHQRTVSKNHEKQVEGLQEKMDDVKSQIADLRKIRKQLESKSAGSTATWTFTQTVKVKEEPESDKPAKKVKKETPKKSSNGTPAPAGDDSDEDDLPIGALSKKTPKKASRAAESDGDDDDMPIGALTKKAKKRAEDDEDDDDLPIGALAAKKPKKPAAPTSGNSAVKTERKVIERKVTKDQAEKKIQQLKARVNTLQNQLQSKEDLKTVALGTSKINYLDPRITVAWCKKHKVPLDKVFQKSLLVKFTWALNVDPEWSF